MAARIFWELPSRSPTVTFICASATRSGRIFMRGVLSQRLYRRRPGQGQAQPIPYTKRSCSGRPCNGRRPMDIQIYAIHVVPFVIIVYFVFVLFLHPPKAVILASLAGGLVMAVINALADLLAYYASWWHYTASGLILQLPLPFYLTPMLIYGAIVYLLIWRFWNGRFRWFALLLLVAVPLFAASAISIVSQSHNQPI